MILLSISICCEMIDGIKCTVHGVDPYSLKQKFDFFTPVNENTGEAQPYSSARWDNLRLTLHQKGTCSIRGSLHKLAHQGINSTDFTYPELCECVGLMADTFETRPENFILHNLEFGVNLDYPPAEIIDNLLLYGFNAFAPMSANRRQSIGMTCELSRYSLKVYGKNQTRLRLETHVSRMQYLQKVSGSLLTFDSIRDKSVLARLGDNLLETWDKVLLREEVVLEGLKAREQEVLAIGRYQHFWTDLQKSNPGNYKKKRARFSELQQLYQTTTRKDDIARLTGEKWATLLQA